MPGDLILESWMMAQHLAALASLVMVVGSGDIHLCVYIL